jgi:glycosyltransferase involved in cell wall biosynthesis
MNTTFVSVLMTSYNREKYIGEAIESVLRSTHENFELIIVDDCSADNTYSIAKAYSEKDKRIRLVKNEKNLGQFANRNKAISLASAELIKFLDSDDQLAPGGLETMVNAITKFPEAGIGVPVRDYPAATLPLLIEPKESVLLHYKGENHLCYGPTGTIFRKQALEAVGGFEGSYGILADTLLDIKVASRFSTVMFENNLFYWRRHEGQVTAEEQDDVKMIGERYRILKAVMADPYLPLSKGKVAWITDNFLKINTRHYLNHLFRGRWKDARKIRKDTDLSFAKLARLLLQGKNSKGTQRLNNNE